MATEQFSWVKWFKGFIPGLNTAKAVVIIFQIVLVLSIGFCIYFTVNKLFIKKAAPVTQTQSYGTVSGDVYDSHDTKNKDSKSYSLINLLCKN